MPSTNPVNSATEQAEALRLAMLYLGRVHDDSIEEHSAEGATYLMGAIYTLRTLAEAADEGDYSEATVEELRNVHNDTVDCLADPTEVDAEKLANKYSKLYGIMASHVVKLIHYDKQHLDGEDDPTFG